MKTASASGSARNFSTPFKSGGQGCQILTHGGGLPALAGGDAVGTALGDQRVLASLSSGVGGEGRFSLGLGAGNGDALAIFHIIYPEARGNGTPSRILL